MLNIGNFGHLITRIKGDKIKLLNMWGPGTYLNVCGLIQYCGKGGIYAVNTTKQGTRDSRLDLSNWIFEE